MNQPVSPQADLMSLSSAGLQAQMAVWGEPKFRAQQIWHWIYRGLAVSFDEMTNLPHALRERLARLYRIAPLTALDEWVSGDQLTRKVLLGLHDGETVESVLMLYDRRQSVCVSTQVGCPVGCAFCATGQSGFRRDLTVGEIVAQPLFFARQLKPQGQTVTNIVLMGMGEPLLNYEAVWGAVERWNDHDGLNLGARRITISTAGYVPGIYQLAQEVLQVGLAVSLHAADDVLRDRLVPLNRAHPLAELMEACRHYVAQTGRRITIEYALIDRVNDAVRQAGQLVELLSGLLCHVNLIPLNPTSDGAFQPSTADRTAAFQRALVQGGLSVTMRLRRGLDIEAGCGQLRRRHVS